MVSDMAQAGRGAAERFVEGLVPGKSGERTGDYDMPPPYTPAMNLLWSFFYLRVTRKMTLSNFLESLAAPRIRFFADSGAHTARTMGKSINLDDYGQWLTQVQDCCTIYANLDVIGAPDATRRNQEYLETQYGLSPMPVFHTGEPFSVLEDYVADGYTYIALGKLLGNSQKALTPWIARCFEVAGDKAVFHGFGLTVWDQLKRFPWYSVDSSSWVGGVRYGEVRLFDAGRWVQISLRDRAKVAQHIKLLRSYGLSARDMSGVHYDRPKIAGACAVAQYRASDWLSARRPPVLLPPGKGYPDPSTPAMDKIVRITPTVPDTLTRYLADTGEKHIFHDEGFKQYLANSAMTNHRRHGDGFSTYLAETSGVWHVEHAKALTLYLADSSSKWTPAAAQAISQIGQDQ